MLDEPPSEADWKARLAAGASSLGVPLEAVQLEKMWQLAHLLRERNRLVNLTSVDTLDGILGVHLLDSLSVAAHFGAAKRIVDVGTGGGFPGLPLAIAFPEREFVLIDGTQKKIAFVRDAVAALGLENVAAEAVRAEQYRPARGFDVVVLRAVAALDTIIKQTRHLLHKPGGVILAMKGKHPEVEVAALPRGWYAEALPLHVPTLAAERTLIRLTPTR